MLVNTTDLNEIPIFTRVALAGSFTKAARELGMPKSTVSRKVADLEQRLGTRLLHRTTRKLSLTDAGRIYLERATRIVTEVDEAALAVSSLQGTPSGRVRVTAPLNVGYFGAMLADFLRRYTEVEVELFCSDRTVNLVEEGFDVAFRAGQLKDSTLVARSLGSLRILLVASPGYLERRGRPKSPEDLKNHDTLLMSAGAERTGWRLGSGGREVEVTLSPRLAVNDFDVLVGAAVAGLGIAHIPGPRCAAEVRAGRLERVLPAWSSAAVPLHAVYPSTRLLSPKVRAFLDHLEAAMKPPPWDLEA